MNELISIIAAIIFWACLGLASYTYCFYPIILFVVYCAAQLRRDWKYLTQRHDRRARATSDESLPHVTIIMPAYNEEAHLGQALASLKAVDYPSTHLQIIVVSDGSTDKTNDILSEINEPAFEIIIIPQRRGKANALNCAVREATNEIIVFSDASTQFACDAVRKLVRHFRDRSVGVACGALTFVRSAESRRTEGVYWKYETILRLMEGRLGATLTASGAIYAIRRECFEPLALDTLIDDLLIPMRARRKGYKVVYDPEATATEFAASGVCGEAARRVRIATGSFRALPELLRTPLPPATFLAFVSHKLLRWTLPFLLIGLLIANGCLLNTVFYRVVFAGQLTFYGWACLGILLRPLMQRIPFALIGYFMVAMNVAFLKGFCRSLRRGKEGTWERIG